MTAWRKTRSAAIGVAVSGALLGLVFSKLGSGRLLQRATELSWTWVAAAFGVSLGVLLLRGLRFAALTEHAGYYTVTLAVAVQNLLLRVMPFRVGEVSLPLLLKYRAGESPVRGTVLLLLVRLTDLWTLLVAASLMTPMLAAGERTRQTVTVIVVAWLFLTALLLTFPVWLRYVVRCGGRLALRLPVARLRPDVKALGQLSAAVEVGSSLGWPKMLSLATTTLAVSAGQYLLFWCLARAFGVQFQLWQLVFGSSLAQVAGAIPLPTVGSIGTHETGWTLGFVLAGVPLADAAVTAIGTQALTLAFAGIFAAPAWILAGAIVERKGPDCIHAERIEHQA